MNANSQSLRKAARGIVLAACTFLLTSACLADEAIAMVTDVTGDVSITLNDKAAPGMIFTSLMPGSELKLGASAQLSLVYFRSAKEYAYTGAARILIEADAPSLVAGKDPAVRELSLVRETGIIPAVEGYGQAALVFRGAAKKPTIRLVRPLNSRVLDEQPSFAWELLEAGVQYRFVLNDEQGRILLETLVNGTGLILPANIRLTPDSLYTWTVEARLATGTVYSSTADFSVINAQERSEITQMRPADNATFSERLLYAALLEKRGLRDAAQVEWGRLAAERPGDAGLKKRAKRDN